MALNSMKKTIKATKESTKQLPETSGVYLFKKGRTILYIGKATSLRDRIRSYFSNDLLETRGPLLVQLLKEAETIIVEETETVIEALILEANLIKQYQPRFNTKEKSDKSFNWVVITKEEFPRVLLMRERELEQKKMRPDFAVRYEFGPFTQATALKEALKIVRKIFPFIDTTKSVSLLSLADKKRLTLNRQIGLYPDVFSGAVSKIEYRKTIQHIKLFFEGKKKTLLKQLEREMKSFAKKREFERANDLKKKIFALQHIQDVSVIKRETVAGGEARIEAYDVAHLAGKAVVGVMTVVDGGETERGQYRKFKIQYRPGINDTQALKEIIYRRLGHTEWPLPKLIVVDGAKAQINAATAICKEVGVFVPIVGVVKNEFHKAREILGDRAYAKKFEKEIILANSEAHRFAIKYHRESLRKQMM
jgi:excinuclease ABC subunit C